MDVLVTVTRPAILVPAALAVTCIYLASRGDVAYLWKWAIWWALWSTRYVLGAFAGDEVWFQQGFLPLSAIGAGFLITWGALQAAEHEMPKWGVVLTLSVVAAWAIQTALDLFPPFSTGALLIPLGYMTASLLIGSIVLYQPDSLAELASERRAVATCLLAMALLQMTFPWVTHMPQETMIVAAQGSTALQLLITVAIVQLHFAKSFLVTEKMHAEMEQQLVTALDDFIPLCMICKDVRVEDGPWQSLDVYLAERTGSAVSHGVCPSCVPKLYGEQP